MCIRDRHKFDSNGNFLLKWGTTGSGDGQFQLVRGIEVDGSGNIFVIDENLRRLYKFDSNGNFITTLVQDLGYTGMRDISLDGSGNIYLIDSGVLGNQVRKFDSSGNFITKWGTKGSGDGEFWSPAGIAIDGSGYVYVSDTDNRRVQKFTLGE